MIGRRTTAMGVTATGAAFLRLSHKWSAPLPLGRLMRQF
jgi:hypothetical protein